MSERTTVSRVSRHLDREPRRGEAVLVRAAVAGIVGGGLLGAAVMVPDLIDYLQPHESDYSYGPGPTGVLIAAVIGALVGLVAAVLAASGWLLTVGPPDRPRLSRAVAGLAAAAPVLLLALPFGGVSLPVVAVSLIAGGLAVTFAPVLGYRPRH